MRLAAVLVLAACAHAEPLPEPEHSLAELEAAVSYAAQIIYRQNLEIERLRRSGKCA